MVEAHREESTGAEGFTDWAVRAEAIRRAVGRFMAVLRLITRPRHQVASRLATTYPHVRLFVPALVDFSYTTTDSPNTDVPEQIAIHSLLAKLSVVGGLPDAPDVRLHPMVGFCPYREVKTSELVDWDVEAGTTNRYVPYAAPSTAQAEDRYTAAIRFSLERARDLDVPDGPWESARLSLDPTSRSISLVRHAIELGGFAGVKVYPPSGFLPIGNVGRFGERMGQPLDAALRALYAYCEAMQVPILTHAAHSIGFGKGYDDLASPTAWAEVLADYPKLRLNFGHFGHLHGIKEGDPAGPDSWVLRFLDLIDRYPHVYADLGNSRLVFDGDYKVRYTDVLKAIMGDGAGDPAVVGKRRRRLLFGSDYWLNTLDPDHANSYDVFADLIEGLFGREVAEWFLGENTLRYLGILDDSGQPSLGNLNRQRLVAFYADFDLPPWLQPAGLT